MVMRETEKMFLCSKGKERSKDERFVDANALFLKKKMRRPRVILCFSSSGNDGEEKSWS
jgi:hypothetical protein